MFSAEATGIQCLSYQWEWKPKKKWHLTSKWQPCDPEWCDGATLTIPKVKTFHVGSYRCVITNDIGSWNSKPANLCIGKNSI